MIFSIHYGNKLKNISAEFNKNHDMFKTTTGNLVLGDSS